MDIQTASRDPARAMKRLSLWDLAIVAAAVAGIIFANVEVVRALDIALDAIHR